MNQKTIIITGGTGFIGSHTCVELIHHYNIVIIDNLSNSNKNVIAKIKQISDSNSENNTTTNLIFYEADLLDKTTIMRIFEKHKPYAVIHFAGLKAVNDSIKNPGQYYQTNIISTLFLLEIMEQHECFNLIFSSSATVYGKQLSPLKETDTVGQNITNPYGQTKYMLEQILRDFYISNKRWNIIVLRYFNPIGAHPSGLIGENPNDTPNNLMPYILKVATTSTTSDTEHKLGENFGILKIFGNDYDTKDGTCQRDFIHVVDLAKGHASALQKINTLQHFHVFNLGTGKPTSVLELVEICKKVNNIEIPYQFAPRREGDIDVCYCNPAHIFNILDWKTEKTLEDMCKDAWNFQKLFG